MSENTVGLIYTLSMIFGIVFFMLIVGYEDGIPINLINRILCRFNFHKNHIKLGIYKKQKYRCVHCNKPRENPSLKVIEGGDKMKDNTFTL